MAKREQMLQQLKRANKRRSRRPVPVAATQTPQGPSQAILAGKLAEAVYEFARRESTLTDNQIHAAVRETLRDREPSDALAVELASAIASGKPAGASDSAWRKALTSFEKDIDEVSRGSSDPRSFISYLDVMMTS